MPECQQGDLSAFERKVLMLLTVPLEARGIPCHMGRQEEGNISVCGGQKRVGRRHRPQPLSAYPQGKQGKVG